MRVVKEIGPPTGVAKVLFRVPIHAYRHHLGWLFGHRLLLVNHVGRVTGKHRQVVLEVVAYDRKDGSHVVVSGWGPTAAWYRNVCHTPEVTIQVGTRTIPVTAVPLTEADGADILSTYMAEHKTAAKVLLPRLMGYRVDGSDADFRALAARLPAVRFVPR